MFSEFHGFPHDHTEARHGHWSGADNFFNSTVHVLVSFTGAALPPRPLISPAPRKSRCIRGEIRCDATTAHRASGKDGSVLHPRCRGTATTGG